MAQPWGNDFISGGENDSTPTSNAEYSSERGPYGYYGDQTTGYNENSGQTFDAYQSSGYNQGQQQPYSSYGVSYGGADEGKANPPDGDGKGTCTCGHGCAANTGCRQGGETRKTNEAEAEMLGTAGTKCVCGDRCRRNTGCRAPPYASAPSEQKSSKSSSGKKKSKYHK